MTTLYGFKSCDTVRKARASLDARGVKYVYFDYHVDKLDPKGASSKAVLPANGSQVAGPIEDRG